MAAPPSGFRPIALRVLHERYLRRDPDGRVVETPDELFLRVARGVAAAEARYGGPEAEARQAAAFHEVLASLKFLPNTPTLMNAGLPQGQLAACFVIPVHDDMRSILEGVRDMALIHQSGGGTGFTFTHLRPRGDQVRSTGRVASGPVGFMRIYDTTTEVVKQGGRRRGANMGILNVDHPDILEFIMAKGEPGMLSNFNLSVAVTDDFMERVERDEDYPLINPRTQQEVTRLKAQEVFDLICRYALETGDPGSSSWTPSSAITPPRRWANSKPPTPAASSPCWPMNPATSAPSTWPAWPRGATWTGGTGPPDGPGGHLPGPRHRQSHYPLPQVTEITHANRKIGLGVIGLADCLFNWGWPTTPWRPWNWAKRSWPASRPGR